MSAVDSGMAGAEDLCRGEERRVRRCARADNGREPEHRRIQRLACRLGGQDVEIEVGQPDPVYGDEVLVILDLGRPLCYAVYTTGSPSVPALQIGRRVYSVTDFA